MLYIFIAFFIAFFFIPVAIILITTGKGDLFD